jgi:hypothetical protein
MRKVTIYSTRTRATQVIETEATTWGELKSLINDDMGVSSSKVMIRENRTTLEHNDAALPEGDITLFLYPEKVKSGTDGDVEIKDVVRAMKSRFDNMFQEILNDIDSGAIKTDIDALRNEAAEIADELGINLGE